MIRTITTACPRNCFSTCGLRVTVEDGRLRRIEAHPGNRATAEAPRLKGLSYVERVYSPDRLLHPLRRTRGGGFERVSWDDAVDLIAGRLRGYRDEPQSVLFYAGSGTKGLMNGVARSFWRLYGGCTTTYGDLCWPAGLEATRLTLGANVHNAPWDLANARLVVLWGKNVAETNVHQMAFVHQALDREAEVVVIDPRRTETAERAALHIRPRPGTDAAIALAVAHRLVERGWVDEPFVRDHVLGYEAFRESVRKRTPAWAAEVAGVPEAEIERLAEFLGTVRPATINAGFGLQRYTNSGQSLRAIIALVALTGNVGKPGAGWAFANLASHVFDPVKDPLAFYPPERPDGVFRVSISTALLGPHMLAQSDPPLRMAWVERGNPVPQNPETPTVLRAFRALEFRVVVDQFLTDTAREADLVLPAKSMFEQTDVIGAYWHDYLQLKQKAIEPPGEVKPESEVYRRLAERLGFPADVIARELAIAVVALLGLAAAGGQSSRPDPFLVAVGFVALFCVDRVYTAIAGNLRPRLDDMAAVASALFLAGVVSMRPGLAVAAGLVRLAAFVERLRAHEGAPGPGRWALAAARVGIGLALPLAMLLAAGPAGLPVALAGAVIGELLDRADFYGSLEVTRHGA